MEIVTTYFKFTDKAYIDNYYNKIINELKQYINSNSNSENTIYIYKNPFTGYSLYNSLGTNITYRYYNKYLESTNELNYNDFLLDTLTELSPKKIVINCEINKNLYNTIKKIFSNVI